MNTTDKIAKEANMEMERFESAIFYWPLAPFDTKLETDAKMNPIRIGPWRPTAGGRKTYVVNGRKDMQTVPWKFRWWCPERKYLKVIFITSRENLAGR